jgi:hypothetical protein
MSEPSVDPHLSAFNPDTDDPRVNANALFFYPDLPDDPLVIVVAFGHVVRLSPSGPLPFDNGSHVQTMPFRVDNLRFNKQLETLTDRDLDQLKAAFKLPDSVPMTFVVREQLDRPVEEHFSRDLQVYGQTYQKQRQEEIVQRFEAAVGDMAAIRMECPPAVTVLFGIDVLPSPTESAVYDAFYRNQPEEVKVYGTLWHLVRRPEYAARIGELAKAVALAGPRLAIHLQSKPDGSWCLGLERREPLALAGVIAEIAHFHRVATSRDEAAELGRALAPALRRQFDLSYDPRVFVDN